jgi:hypothetical protein
MLQFFPLLFLSVALGQDADVRLRAVARVPTLGAAGFEYFTTPRGPALASAHFWDGKAHDMSAASIIYAVSTEPNGNLTLAELQRFPTKGAHGWDHFVIPGEFGGAFLVTCNYYGCGSDRGPALGACNSTSVYRYSEPDGLFLLHQTLATAGPAQTDHIVLHSGDAYVLVGENFNDEVCTYRYTVPGGRFVKSGCLPVPGAGAMAIAEAAGFLYLTLASYHHNGWTTRSPVFRAQVDDAPLRWTLHQTLHTAGAHDADSALIGGVE